VYQTDRTEIVVAKIDRRLARRAWRSVAPNVWLLGMTSLLTDVSSEMIASVLPVYLVVQLNLSPLAFGTLDGLYNGVGAVTRGVSGVLADRWRRHKEVAIVGYGISALCRLVLLAAGRNWLGLSAAIVGDRLAKGIRTAPRDALISLSASPGQLGHAFGVHRAMDAAGAMLGPMVAFALLGLVPGGFDVVFVVSFCVAVIGVGVLWLLVDKPAPAAPTDPPAPEPTWAAAFALLGRRDFRTVVLAAAALALVTISDAFVYLVLQERLQFAPAFFPLLYAGTGVSYLMLAIPAGLLADRFGRPRVFLFGQLALLLVYAVLIAPASSAVLPVTAVILLGTYYACTDGVIAALASGLLPPTLRGSGLATLASATSVCRLVASIAFGWIWMAWSREMAIVWFSVALSAGIAAAAATVGRSRWNVHD
jgi:MFS family permease